MGGHLRDEGLTMGEEALIARTEVVLSRFSIRCPEEAVLRALAVAHGPDLAFPAEAG